MPEEREKYRPDPYFTGMWRRTDRWPTPRMKRTARSAWRLALLGAILVLCAAAAPVAAADATTIAAQWDPTPWVAFGSVLLIATLVSADAKADRRGH